jgi:hypothetical protein
LAGGAAADLGSEVERCQRPHLHKCINVCATELLQLRCVPGKLPLQLRVLGLLDARDERSLKKGRARLPIQP